MEDNTKDNVSEQQIGPTTPDVVKEDEPTPTFQSRELKDFKPKRGRPPKPKFEIQPATIEEYGRIMLTTSDMAKVFGITQEELDKKYKTEIDKWRAVSRAELLTAQFQLARKGNPTMLIWLGKQYLGQKDMVEAHNNSDGTFTIHVGRNTRVNARVDINQAKDMVEKVIDTTSKVVGPMQAEIGGVDDKAD